MTNQNNIAQAAMQQAVSDDDLLRICQQFNPGQDLDLAKAVRDAVLSKLRAPVADIAAIIRDVCELDPADEGPDTVSVSVTDLRRIIERHSAPVATETLDEGNAPVPLKGHSMGPLTPVCDYTGSLIGQTVATARHGAYEGSVIWVRMLRAGEWMPWRVADKQSAPVAGEPAFYINSSLIDPRTGHIKAEIRDPLTWSDTPVGNWLTPVFIAPVAGERALFALKHIGTWAGIGAGMKTHKEVREYAKHNAQACTPAADMGNPMSIPRVADERAAFEANFPVPVHCQWIGNGYASTEYNAWDAIKHKTRWEGWQARAALASAPVADERAACPTDVCQAGKADGVLCANDECDRASGVRPPMCRIPGVREDVLRRAAERMASAPVANDVAPAGMKEICPECGHQFGCFHSPYIDKLRVQASAPVAGEAQPVCWVEKDVLESVRDEGSDAWVYWRPAGHVAEPDEMPLYAAPQASAGAFAKLQSAYVGACDRIGELLAEKQACANAAGEALVWRVSWPGGRRPTDWRDFATNPPPSAEYLARAGYTLQVAYAAPQAARAKASPEDLP